MNFQILSVAGCWPSWSVLTGIGRPWCSGHNVKLSHKCLRILHPSWMSPVCGSSWRCTAARYSWTVRWMKIYVQSRDEKPAWGGLGTRLAKLYLNTSKTMVLVTRVNITAFWIFGNVIHTFQLRLVCQTWLLLLSVHCWSQDSVILG